VNDPSSGAAVLVREFPDNALVRLLFGPHNVHLDRIEAKMGVTLAPLGNTVTISGGPEPAAQAGAVLDGLYDLARRQGHVESADVETAMRMVGSPPAGPDLSIRTRKKAITPRTPTQAAYIQALDGSPLTFGLGPAGTGKTYLAVAKAVAMMSAGEVDRIILSRPAVEAGERLGFLPGDLKDKVDPYLRPLYDALHDMLPAELVAKKMAAGEIEVAPLAFMRGRTLSNAFVILDEAQNTTPMQMKMFLTRMGEHSRMAVTGDPSQTDLPPGVRSGLTDAIAVLDGLDGVRFVRFTDRDVVRHDLVSRIVRAYDRAERADKEIDP
jgi:phosphate starvation-inducible PhoH-like protein